MTIVEQKETLKGLISEKVDTLARQAMPGNIYADFPRRGLRERVEIIQGFAAIAGDNRVASACGQWLGWIEEFKL